MLQAARDFHAMTGQLRGVKLAGGIRTSKQAVHYLVMVNEIAGPAWLTPDLFRFGASALLDDLVMQRHKIANGHYDSSDYVSAQ
jgi:deoxyribose-phosphate aldolase